MKYPDEVLTKSKKGRIEVRKLIDRGSFVRYEYIDPESGERSENKIKLVLLSDKEEEFFIIPMRDGRMLMLPAESRGERRLWDGERVVDL